MVDNTQNELSLSRVFRILLKRIVVLLIVLVSGIAVGAGYGLMKTVNQNYYGTTMEFYVNPRVSADEEETIYHVYGAYTANVMDNLIKLLNSDMFAEKLFEDLADAPPAKIDGKSNPEYKQLLYKVQNSVHFSYYNDQESENVNSIARCFIIANVASYNDLPLADFLVSQIQVKVPEFIKENMIVPTGFTGTNCERISRLEEVTNLTAGVPLSTAIKYGLILGIAAMAVACVIVVVVDYTKKEETVSDDIQ